MQYSIFVFFTDLFSVDDLIYSIDNGIRTVCEAVVSKYPKLQVNQIVDDEGSEIDSRPGGCQPPGPRPSQGIYCRLHGDKGKVIFIRYIFISNVFGKRFIEAGIDPGCGNRLSDRAAATIRSLEPVDTPGRNGSISTRWTGP
jgi:hypothetical protein